MTSEVDSSKLPDYVPEGNRESKIKHPTQPEGWNSLTPWGDAINITQSQKYIEFRNWEITFDVNGDSKTLEPKPEQLEAGLFEPWFENNEHSLIDIKETQNGMRLPVNPDKVTHWFYQTPRPQFNNVDNVEVKAEVKIPSGVFVANGGDWWKTPKIDFEDGENNKAIGRSDWYRSIEDTEWYTSNGNDWQTIKFNNEDSLPDLLSDVSLEINIKDIFNNSFYLNQNPDVKNAVEQGSFESGLQHFREYGLEENRIPTNVLQNFNPESYRNQNPEVEESINNNTYQSALDHFLGTGFKDELTGVGFPYDESFYLNENPDVAQAVKNGNFNSGFEHFAKFGIEENRVPIEDILHFDAKNYLGSYPDVKKAVQEGTFSSALEHLINHGLEEGRDIAGL